MRFYKLDWGENIYPHPDEYHIVAAVDRLHFPDKLNPELFSYGSLTVYLIYFTKLVFTPLLPGLATVNNFLIGRFYSALFSSLTILLVFSITRRLLNKESPSKKDAFQKYLPLLTMFLVATTPGLIQQAHFTTPESILVFWLFLALWLLLKYLEKGYWLYYLLAGVSLGLGIGTKTVAATFLVPYLLTPFLKGLSLATQGESFSRNKPNRLYRHSGLDPESMGSIFQRGITLIFTLAVGLSTVLLFAFVSFPYMFLDFPSFFGTWQYETGLARGTIPVFYMRQFIDTIPLLFQFEKIFPFALGSALTVFGTFGFVAIVLDLLKYSFISFWKGLSLLCKERPSKNRAVLGSNPKIGLDPIGTAYLTLLILSFLSYFIPNAFLFSKWTRFIAPSFPFFSIFTVYFLYAVLKGLLKASPCTSARRRLARRIRNLSGLLLNPKGLIIPALILFIVIFQSLWCLSFFSIYLRPDVRWAADSWIMKNVPAGSSILVEGGNTADLPLTGNYPRTSLHFYEMDENSTARERLFDSLADSDYFFVQSRRVFENHLNHADQFPFIARFYHLLFSEQLGYRQVAEFSSYPQLKLGTWQMEFPDEFNTEETWSVFDHPVIRVFKKVHPVSAEEYKRLF